MATTYCALNQSPWNLNIGLTAFRGAAPQLRGNGRRNQHVAFRNRRTLRAVHALGDVFAFDLRRVRVIFAEFAQHGLFVREHNALAADEANPAIEHGNDFNIPCIHFGFFLTNGPQLQHFGRDRNPVSCAHAVAVAGIQFGFGHLMFSAEYVIVPGTVPVVVTPPHTFPGPDAHTLPTCSSVASASSARIRSERRGRGRSSSSGLCVSCRTPLTRKGARAPGPGKGPSPLCPRSSPPPGRRRPDCPAQ